MSPHRRAERRPGWRLAQGRRSIIVRVHIHSVPPPLLQRVLPDRVVIWKLQAEEDHDDRDGDARVERGGEDVVVFRPPREVPPSNNVLEDEPDDRPRHVVDRCRWWDKACTGEDDGQTTRVS